MIWTDARVARSLRLGISENALRGQQITASLHWDPTFSVNVGAMDDQHKVLFELLDELQRAVISGRGPDVTGDVLRRLVEYTAYHFSAEEKLMEKYKFAGLATHRGEHMVLTEKVLALKKEFDAGNTLIASELERFLERWLKHHIQIVDHRYSDFLNAHGVH